VARCARGWRCATGGGGLDLHLREKRVEEIPLGEREKRQGDCVGPKGYTLHLFKF